MIISSRDGSGQTAANSSVRFYVGSSISTLIALTCLLSQGCAGYQVGSRTLFRPDIRTVHVPMFYSDALRRNVAEWLTEAVVKEVENRTPYKVVAAATADTVLSGRVLSISKTGLAETANDDLRDLEVELYVEVRWQDNAGNILMQHVAVPIETAAVTSATASHFIPEAGQSMVTAQQRDIRRAAQQIVSLMEFTPL